MATGIKFGKGWKNLRAALKPGAFTKRLQEEVARATEFNAMLVSREMREAIKSGVDPANAALTAAIKGSDKPLIDKGALWKAITSKKLTWQTGFAGLLRGRRGADGELINVGAVLHEGASMRVTEAMRGLFLALANASRSGDASKLTGRALELWERTKSAKGPAGRDAKGRFTRGTVSAGFWKPLAPETTAIVIPSRPWIEIAMKTPGLRAKLKRNWEAAVQRAITPRGA